MNAEESAALAQAFVSEAFLEAQVERKPGALYLTIVCAWAHRMRSLDFQICELQEDHEG